MLKQGMGMLTTHKFPVFTLDPAIGNRKFQRNENQWSMAKTIMGKSGINKSLFSLRCSLPSISGREKFLVGFTPKIFPLPCDKNETNMGLRPKERGVARASPGKRKEHPTSGELGSAKKGRGIVDRIIHDAKHGSDSEPPSIEPTIDLNDKSNLDSAVTIKQPGDYQLNGKPKQEGQMLRAGSGVKVDLEVGDGEYILKIKRRKIQCSTEEEMVNEAKKMTQNAAILLVQAKMLRDMGEQLLDQYQQSLQYIFGKSASTNDNLD